MRRIAMLVVIAVPGVVSAQPAFEKAGTAADVKDVEEVVWTAKGEAGLVASTGNSETTTITIGGNAIRKDKDNKIELTLAGAYARATTRVAVDANADGAIAANELGTASATSAENLAGKLRYDRYLTPADSLYVAALAATDRPAGKSFYGGVQVGYSRALLKTEEQELLGEVGYDLTYVRLDAGSSSTVHSARLFAGYKAKIKEETALEASVEALLNGNKVTYGMREAAILEASRVNGMIGVTTSLSTKVSLNASFTAKYDHFPAPLAKIGNLPFVAGFEPAADSLDTITKISVIVKFL